MNAIRHKGRFTGAATKGEAERSASESAIQKTFANWCALCLPDDVLSFAVCNESDGSAKYSARMKAQGRRAGAADYAIIYQGRYHAIEFKSAKGTQRPSQRDFQHHCERAGAVYAVARSSSEAIALLEGWGIPHNDRRNTR